MGRVKSMDFFRNMNSAAVHGATDQLPGHPIQLLVVPVRGDDELHRQAASRAGQAGPWEDGDLEAGDVVQLGLKLRLNLHL